MGRAWLFLGGEGGLWNEFREIVGWNEGVVVGGGGGGWEVREGVRRVDNVPRERGKEEGGKMCGPSYRRLPGEEIELTCSGRDKLCWEVLNDEWS